MTQPQVQDPNATGKVIVSAALALALISIEQQARDDVDATVGALYKGLAAAGLLAAASAPATVVTGLALISLPIFHQGTSRLFQSARLKIRDTVSTAYQAAARTAQSKLTDELGDDFDVPDDLPDLGGALDSLLRDVDTMFGHAQTRLQNLVQAAYDPNNKARLADDIVGSDSNLAARAVASAATAVHRGSTDATTALYTEMQLRTSQVLMKRWRTTSNDPCGMCSALNGTRVGITADFNALATDDPKDFRPAWRNLAGPPRHPNCRCQIDLVVA